MLQSILALGRLRYVLAVAEHGSFRKAALTLNVAESTISRTVQRLEEAIGGAIFTRSHAGVRITPAGERFLKDVELGIDHFRRAVHRVTAAERGEQGEVRIGLAIPFQSAVVGATVAQFRAQYPSIAVEVVEDSSAASSAGVLRHQVDIAFVLERQESPGCEGVALGNHSLVVALPADHQLAQQSRLSWQDIRHETFIFTASGMGPNLRDHVAAAYADLLVTPSLGIHRVGQCNLLGLVAHGFGVTVLPKIDDVPSGDQLVFLPIDRDSSIPVGAIWSADNTNPALGKLLEVVEGHQQDRH